jgi:ATP-binding cassette, subfamily C (CFTR/MRP), member 4
MSVSPTNYFQVSTIRRRHACNVDHGWPNSLSSGQVTIYDFMVGAFMFLGSVCTAIAVLPVVLVVIPPLVILFTRDRRCFVATTRELKRLEGLARSPIYATLSETMLGIATIRTTGSFGFFAQKFSQAHDKHTRAAWAFMASSRWFAISLDMLSFILLTTATFAAVVFHHQQWLQIDPATLGLALTLLIQMANTNFPWMIRQSAEVTNQMVAVERILEFCRLEGEAPLSRDTDKLLDESWPGSGDIDVRSLSVRYRPGLPLAIDGVTFRLESGSRVGIVGRTGSGKSTLVQSLFRLLEAEDGSIHMDGVDIATVGLHRLRKRISVIPQAPTLFSGCTIRENLDLFGVHTDAEVEKAIEDSHLKDLVSSLPSGMHSLVSEGGSNFSVGQRQLLCLARAIVSRNKILVLDEATANVDRRTDQLIQETLEKSFRDGTIIAVAHRLETILHSDSIIVMGNAKVLEQESPEALLANNSSHFYAMARSGGHLTRSFDAADDA